MQDTGEELPSLLQSGKKPLGAFVRLRYPNAAGLVWMPVGGETSGLLFMWNLPRCGTPIGALVVLWRLDESGLLKGAD